MPQKTAEHPVQDWVSQFDANLTQPFEQLNQDIQDVRAMVQAIAVQPAIKADRRNILVGMILLVGGLAWVQIGHPVVRGVVTQVQEVPQQIEGIKNVLTSPLTREWGEVATVAKQLDGQSFKSGETAMCAVFVRYAIAKAGYKIGVTQKPIDGHETSEAFANSFFGEDIGQIIRDKTQLQPGDLVAFGGTYGGYSKDTITHVGIYVGDGQMVDRGTMEGTVTLRPITTFEHFVAGVRPNYQKGANNP